MGGWGGGEDDGPEVERASTNAARAMARVREIVNEGLRVPESFRLTTALLCELHALVLDGQDGAGALRTRDVTIEGSVHEPPPWKDVPALLEGMCAAANEATEDAVTRAAFVLWRMCWIHPFAPDGNGRTARAAAYIVLCIALGQEPPGPVTAFERMTHVGKRSRYHGGLEAADRAWKTGAVVDVSALADLLEELLVEQIRDR